MPVYSSIVGDEHARRLAGRLREARTQHGWTLKDLAVRVSASVATLSSIENLRVSPDLELLVRLSEVFGTSIESLCSHGTAEHFCVSRRNEVSQQPPAPLRMIGPGGKATAKYHNRLWPLADAFVGKYIEPFEIEVQPIRDDELQFISHTHEEFLFVVHGRIEVLIKTGQTVVRERLKPGDCIYFWSYLPHCIRSTTADPARTLHVLSALNEPVDSETAESASGRVICMKETLVKGPVEQIGARMAAARRARGMSAGDLARRLGISLRRLARIERGAGSMSFKLLLDVCRTFRKPPDYFLVTAVAPDMCSFVDRAAALRRASWQQLDRTEKGKCLVMASAVALAAGFKRKSMRPWLVTLDAPPRQARKLETHPVQEFAYVLNGEVELTATQNNQAVVTRLSPGDSCFLDSSMPHSFAAASVSPYDAPHARILVVRSDSSREAET
jgi:transcriptional regulator with XRE-family HTH domain